MKKHLFIIYLLFTSLLLFTTHIYDSFDYRSTSTDPIRCTPEPGIYRENIFVSFSSEYGKIYYFPGNDLSKFEPVEYTSPLFLKGEKDYVNDYEIMLMLEKEDGSIELFSKSYRIDMTARSYSKGTGSSKSSTKKEEEKTTLPPVTVTKESKSISELQHLVSYNFSSKEYSLSLTNREIELAPQLKMQSSQRGELLLEGQEGTMKGFIAAASYLENEIIKTEYDYHTIDATYPEPPSFGSLYWGQLYKQSYRLQIRPAKRGDNIYYWLREWKSTDIIFGPPETTDISRWKLYKDPIELYSKYGSSGIMGIAAFSVGENGRASKISGPFYFKVTDVDNRFEQVFEDYLTEADGGGKIYLNNTLLDKKYGVKNRAAVRFESFNSDERFYFIYKSSKHEGRSALLPCSGEYTFKNSSEELFEVELYYSSGEKAGSFQVKPELTLPQLKDYRSNYVEASSDMVFDFRMPAYKVRFSSTTNLRKYLTIDENSKEFKGRLKISAQDGEEVTYKVKFASYDEKDNLIAESDYYYFKIDKRSPLKEVAVSGVDFKIRHNEKQVVTLIPSEKSDRIYYRLSRDMDWVLYEGPILFNPPSMGQYEVQLFLKSIDSAGNERANKSSLKLAFDRRGIFVDTSLKFSGNGTESAPLNSLERGFQAAKDKEIKMIYLLSDTTSLSHPFEISSDTVVQPFKKGARPTVKLETRSIWRKSHSWFNVKKSGYLEFRNIDFDIKSGSNFLSLEGAKAKCYNLNIYYTGTDSIKLLENRGGKLGLNNSSLNIVNNPDSFSLLESRDGVNLISKVTGKIIADEIKLFNLKNSLKVKFDNIKLDVTANGSLNLLYANRSNLELDNIIYRQNGAFNSVELYKIKSSTLNLSNSDFIIDSENCFETAIMDLRQSQAEIKSSLFRVNGSHSVIGFNSFSSRINFEQSMLDVKDIADYIYSFRMEKSGLLFNSSIIRNMNSESAVSFLLNESDFEGANNSLFNVNIRGRSFNFWVNHRASLTTVNSLYYSNSLQGESTFIYLNNRDYDKLTPVWYSNAVSSGIVTLENLTRRDSDELVKEFSSKNIYYDFKDSFDLEGDEFFLPLADSPLLQGGIDQGKSPVKISELDFYGRSRLLQGYGIDIGAVQKSGY